MDEFELIEKLKNKSAPSAIRVGIGDDCAVLPKDAKTDLVVTADLLVEDIDFRLSWSEPEFIGHKALAVSLSDVAAMGAKPVWAMLSIGVPASVWRTDFVDKFYEGWFCLAKKYAVELIGGDVSKTPDKIVIDSIVAGEVKKGRAVLRSGAKIGDLIFVTGNLGGAAAGLKLLENGVRFGQTESKNLLLRQLTPQPRTEIGQVLSENNLASAMIDVSDGLSSDLAHLCRASKVGAKIYSEKIPLDKNFAEISSENLDFLNFALAGGEDFELLFTIKPQSEKKILRLKNESKNFTFTRIGEVTETTEIIELISNSETRILAAKGFRHF